MRTNGLCFSSDGSLLFVASWDCSLHIHDLRRGVSIRSLHAHRHGIESVYILPSSNHLCLCPSKLQGPPHPAKQSKQPSGGGPPTAGRPADAGGRLQHAEVGGGGPQGPPLPFINRGGGHTYNLRLWDLRENRYVKVLPVSARVIPGTGVSVHPKKSTFFCCTDDGWIKYFCTEKEMYLWKRQANTRRPLATIEGEGNVGALYEGEGLVSLWDLNRLTEPFLRFKISQYLMQQKPKQQQETPTSLSFSPDGAWLLIGTDKGRLLALSAFTGELAAVWVPPKGSSTENSSFWGRELDKAGAFLIEAFMGDLSQRDELSPGSSVSTEGFIHAVDIHSDVLLYGNRDGWVYGYDLTQALKGAAASQGYQKGSAEGEEHARRCSTCGGRQRRGCSPFMEYSGASSADARAMECCCDITHKHRVALGPHWGAPLWVACNPKHEVVATAGLNCSVWKASVR
ncbi:WD-40 repeat-containing protein [Cyclospora cayetanensis]|nr:WD-40 repeat-containing protein [Cyclospora cayetanensis]